MNTYKAILAAALGLSAVCASQAANVYITGSTAMRSVVYSALMTPNLVFSSAPVFTGFGGSGNGDTYMAFTGTLKGGSGSTTIKCTWSGSEAGIGDLVSATPETFISDSYVTSNSGTDNGSGTLPGADSETAVVNIALADSAQAYSHATSPVLSQSKEVGIVTFKWVRNAGVWTGGNVTDQQIRAALGGAAPIGLFTGANDDSSYVYVAGRDTSSGTRVNALGESGYGITTPVAQIELSGGVMQDINNDGTYEGNYGQSSGGTLAKSLLFNTTSGTDSTANGGTGFSVIAYLGYNDAKTALTGTPAATELTYNGVAFSPVNIENGTYNFWGNEYVYAANSVTSTANPAAYLAFQNLENIAHGIDTAFDGNAAIPLSAMHASRPGPNGDPSHK